MRVRLSKKGQIVIPKVVRDRQGWSPGSELTLEDRGDAILIRTARPDPETTFDDLIGCTAYRGPARSLDEMDGSISRGARGLRRP